MAGRRSPRPKAPTLPQQLANLRLLHPSLEGRIDHQGLTVEGWIRGNQLTARYRVRIEHRPGWWPRAVVLEPALERRHPDQPVAHTNSPDEPCLFTKNRDWHWGMYLGQTIVPWLMEWLVFYETWRYTGEWRGGGTLPADYEARIERPNKPAA